MCYDGQATAEKLVFFYVAAVTVIYQKEIIIGRWKRMRTRITLACTECKQRNYNTTKDKKTHPDRMETKKYCRFCKKHTTHKETK